MQSMPISTRHINPTFENNQSQRGAIAKGSNYQTSPTLNQPMVREGFDAKLTTQVKALAMAKKCIPNKIHDLTEIDILSGRGSGINDHPGNMSFRELIHQHKKEYQQTKKRDEKHRIVSNIYQQLSSAGSNFLKPITLSKPSSAHAPIIAHFELTESQSFKKISEALREIDKTPTSNTAERAPDPKKINRTIKRDLTSLSSEQTSTTPSNKRQKTSVEPKTLSTPQRAASPVPQPTAQPERAGSAQFKVAVPLPQPMETTETEQWLMGYDPNTDTLHDLDDSIYTKQKDVLHETSLARVFSESLPQSVNLQQSSISSKTSSESGSISQDPKLKSAPSSSEPKETTAIPTSTLIRLESSGINFKIDENGDLVLADTDLERALSTLIRTQSLSTRSLTMETDDDNLKTESTGNSESTNMPPKVTIKQKQSLELNAEDVVIAPGETKTTEATDLFNYLIASDSAKFREEISEGDKLKAAESLLFAVKQEYLTGSVLKKTPISNDNDAIQTQYSKLSDDEVLKYIQSQL